MLGREKKNEPVCIASVAWKCSLSSDFIELISAMSSICSRRWGKTSLTMVPHLPPGLNCQSGRSSFFFSRDRPPPGTSVLPSISNSAFL